MSSYLLDTNHLSKLLDQRFAIRARVLDARVRGDTFHLIVPLITETIAGFSILPRAARNWIEWRLVRPALDLLPLDEEDAESAALLQVTLRRAGRQRIDGRCSGRHRGAAVRPDRPHHRPRLQRRAWPGTRELVGGSMSERGNLHVIQGWAAFVLKALHQALPG